MARVNDLNVTKLRQKNVQCQQTNIVYLEGVVTNMMSKLFHCSYDISDE